MANIAQQITLSAWGGLSGPTYDAYYSFDGITYTPAISGSNLSLPTTGSTAIIYIPDVTQYVKLVNDSGACGAVSTSVFLGLTTTSTSTTSTSTSTTSTSTSTSTTTEAPTTTTTSTSTTTAAPTSTTTSTSTSTSTSTTSTSTSTTSTSTSTSTSTTSTSTSTTTAAPTSTTTSTSTSTTTAAFVYYGATGVNSINLGFQKWFKGVQSSTYTTDPITSGSYTITARSIENASTTNAYTVGSGILFQMTGSVSGSGTLANMFAGTYPNQTGDERAGNGVGYGMLVQGPSDLRSNPLNSMPRPIAQRVKVRPAAANVPFNYIDSTGSVVTATLASTSTDYFFDVQGVWAASLEPNTTVWTTFGLAGPATGSFTGYTEGTRQYTATKVRGSNMTLNWVKQFATASMDMQNALVSATTYTFKAALPPNSSNFSYGWSGSAII